jgi:hypothetical protein
VAICPTITFARRGGEVVATSFQELGERGLAARLEPLLRPKPAPTPGETG